MKCERIVEQIQGALSADERGYLVFDLSAFRLVWIVVSTLVIASSTLAAPLTAAELWKQYAAAPNTNPNIPNCSFAGYRCGESALPALKVATNVKDTGAMGDGQADDTAAFAKAIDQAKASGGAVLVPAGTYRIEGLIRLKESGVVLRGAGRGKTVLDFRKSLAEAVDPLVADGKSIWSWSGGLVWIGPDDTFDAAGKLADFQNVPGQPAWEGWRPGSVLTEVSGPAKIGDTIIDVASSAGLKPGMIVLMTWDNPGDFSLLKHIAGHAAMDAYPWNTATWILPPMLPVFQWPVEIADVQANKVMLKQPLRVDVRPEWHVRFVEIGSHVEEVGIEDLTIQCHAPATHKHLANQGHNGIYVDRAYNCFVKNVEIRSAENGINVAASKNVTVSQVLFTGPEQHHHTLACRDSSHDILFEHFEVNGPLRVKHGINTEFLSSGNVWRDGKMPKGTFDSHRALSFDSIRTDITLANDADGPGGAGEAGPFLGKRIVHWNINIEHSPRKIPGEFVFQPEVLPMGAVVGIRGAPLTTSNAPAMPQGDKGCLIVEPGKQLEITDLYAAQLKLRLVKGK